MGESDAKNSFNELNGSVEVYHWSIVSLCCDAKARSIDFNSYCFCLVRCKANSLSSLLSHVLFVFKILLFSVVIRSLSILLYLRLV
jgi:hypothetical protein